MAIRAKSGLKSIYEVINQEMDNIAIIYGHSKLHTWSLLAFQVNQVNRRTQHITNVPSSTTPELAGGATLTPGYFGESGHSEQVSSPGDPQTRIETNFPETIIEYGFAITPGNVRVWAENPGGERIAGVQADRLRGLGPGDQIGPVWSQWTETEEGLPTTALSPHPSQGMIRIDQADQARNNIYIGFENMNDEPASLKVFAVGMVYKVTQLQDEEIVRNVLFGEKNIKRRVLTWGGLKNTSPNLPTDWTDPVEVTDDDVRKAMKGGRK